MYSWGVRTCACAFLGVRSRLLPFSFLFVGWKRVDILVISRAKAPFMSGAGEGRTSGPFRSRFVFPNRPWVVVFLKMLVSHHGQHSLLSLCVRMRVLPCWRIPFPRNLEGAVFCFDLCSARCRLTNWRSSPSSLRRSSSLVLLRDGSGFSSQVKLWSVWLSKPAGRKRRESAIDRSVIVAGSSGTSPIPTVVLLVPSAYFQPCCTQTHAYVRTRTRPYTCGLT